MMVPRRALRGRPAMSSGLRLVAAADAASSSAWRRLNGRSIASRAASASASHVRRSSMHNSASADKDRYLGVRAYFQSIALQQEAPRSYHVLGGRFGRRSLFTSAIAREGQQRGPGHLDGEDKAAGKLVKDGPEADQRKTTAPAEINSDTGQPPRNSSLEHIHRNRNALQEQHSLTEPYHNYPRSLRELAMEASSWKRRQQAEALIAAQERAEREAEASSSADGAAADRDGHGQQQHQHGQSSQHHRTWHRPSKEDLLRFAQGFWTRLRIRFKWFTIRSFRRFNADDISAFFTLGSVGTIIWVVVGTTTFVSVVFAALNALNLQQWIARKLADYLTAETGVTVVFESAIVPKWKDSRISFKNVFISRRADDNPEQLKQDRQALLTGRRRLRRKGTATTAGEGMAWEGMHYEDQEITGPMSDDARGQNLPDEGDEPNTNFTMFDLNVDSIDVQLSFRRWWDGKGIVKDAVVRGVRGIIDRRNVHWDPEKAYDPKLARRKGKRGDFEIESVIVEDFLVTMYQPGDFRPFNISVFDARLPRLRRQWIFFDILSAESITGQVDGCLISLHKPQSIGKTTQREREVNKSRWDMMSRIRVDGVNFDHIQSQQAELSGPMAWITSGKFDVVADIRFPREVPEDVDINAIISEIASNISGLVHGQQTDPAADRPIPGQHRLSGPAIEAPVTTVGPNVGRTKDKDEASTASESETAVDAGEIDVGFVGQQAEAQSEGDDKVAIPAPTVIIDLDVRFKDIKAAVPLFTKDLSYRNNAFVRPIVAFMNANRTLIPIHARIVMDLSEFDGSMDLAQTGLLPIMSEKVYQALANHVASQNANQQRLRNVSTWSLRILADAALRIVVHVRNVFTGNDAAEAQRNLATAESV